jgi:hypothetical protein
VDMDAAPDPATNDCVKRPFFHWTKLVFGLVCLAAIGLAFTVPISTPTTATTAPMSQHESEQVLVPVPVATPPTTAVTLVVEPDVVLVMLDEVETLVVEPDVVLVMLDEVDTLQEEEQEQEEVEGDDMPELLAELIVVVLEETLDLDIVFDLDATMYNSTSTVLLEEEEEEEVAPMDAVLTVVAPQAPPVAFSIAISEEIFIQEVIPLTVAAPAVPPAASLIV